MVEKIYIFLQKKKSKSYSKLRFKIIQFKLNLLKKQFNLSQTQPPSYSDSEESPNELKLAKLLESQILSFIDTPHNI